MAKHSSKKRQRIYRMKGCSKKTKTHKNYLGGTADINLAYPTDGINFLPNPNLAYVGGQINLAKANPNLGGNQSAHHFLNSQGAHSGGCGTCGTSGMSGGSCETCHNAVITGGKKHRKECKCSLCKSKRGRQSGGNQGIPYPSGLAGSPWTPSISGWPGVDGIQGGRNYLAPNNYQTDISRQMASVGANSPFIIGGGKRNKSNTKKQRGGALSNFITQDLINLGRQFQFGMGSAYNALNGYGAPVNPMPWKEQLQNTPNLNSMRAISR